MKKAEITINAPMGYHWVWSQAAQDAADYLGFAPRLAGTPIFDSKDTCDTAAPMSLLDKGYVEMVPFRNPSNIPDIPVYIALVAGILLASGQITPLATRDLIHQVLSLAQNYELTHNADENYLDGLESWAADCLLNMFGCKEE